MQDPNHYLLQLHQSCPEFHIQAPSLLVRILARIILIGTLVGAELWSPLQVFEQECVGSVLRG